MEHETEGTVPPPPEVGVGRGSRDCAGEWGQPAEACLPSVSLVVGFGMWHLFLFDQPARCMYPLPFAMEGATWKGLK